MKRQIQQLTVAFLLGGTVVLSGCTNEAKAPPTADAAREQSAVTVKQGVAGGVYEEVFVVQAIVTAVDLPSRRVTLKGPEGNQVTFVARPEIRNLPQLAVNDKVTATFSRRLVITVRADEAPPSVDRSSVAATARPGDKPGVLVAEETERVARVTAINSVSRTADLQFSNGTVNNIPIRADVDLSRYKVGDQVVIRVTSALTVLTETP